MLNLLLVNMVVFMFCLLFFYLDWFNMGLDFNVINEIVKFYKVYVFIK